MGKNTYPLVKRTSVRVPYSWSYEYCNGGTPPFSCNAPVRGVTSGSISYEDTVTLGKSPDQWRKYLALGRNASSSLSGIERTRSRPAGGSYSYNFGDNLLVTGSTKCIYGVAGGDLGFADTGWPAVPSGFADSLADSLAREKLLGKYLNARKTWRGGNFLAEVAETYHQLKHPIESLFGSTMRFARRVGGIRHLRGKQYAGALGNLWIAWSFGWKPLFDDIKDANEAINRLASGTDHDTLPISATGTVNSSIFTGNTVGLAASPVPLNSYCKFDRYSSSKSQVKYYGALRATPENFYTVADTFGVTPDDILPAVWEAIPWSFFVDYFANVQQVLDAQQYANSYLAWMNRGVRNSRTNTSSGWYTDLTGIPPNQRPLVQPGVGGGSKTTTAKNRSIQGSFPVPPFRFKIPNFNSAKGLNVAGLAAQIAASKP